MGNQMRYDKNFVDLHKVWGFLHWSNFLFCIISRFASLGRVHTVLAYAFDRLNELLSVLSVILRLLSHSSFCRYAGILTHWHYAVLIWMVSRGVFRRDIPIIPISSVLFKRTTKYVGTPQHRVVCNM